MHNNYYEKLISVTERDSAMEHYENRERSFMDFRNQVKLWISLIGKQLSEQLDHGSVSDDNETKVNCKDLRSNNDSYHSKTSRYSKVLGRTKSSRHASSEARFSSYARLQEEKAKIAELKAEKLMLKRKQAIKAAEEELQLDTEIAKVQAREKVFEEINEVKSQSEEDKSEKMIDRAESQMKDPVTTVQPPPKPYPYQIYQYHLLRTQVVHS